MKLLVRSVLAATVALSLCSCAEVKSLGGIDKLQKQDTTAEVVITETAFSGSQRPANAEAAMARPYIEQSLQSYVQDGGSMLETSQGESTEILDSFAPEEPLAAPAADPSASGSIIGTDDRVTVRDSYQYPYSAVAFMKVHARCGDTWESSGFMVQPNILMTAAHCLVCTEHHQTADNIELYFGHHSDGSYAYGYWGPTNYWYGTDFTGGYTDENMAWDFGIVRLEENVGETTGWLGMSVKSDNAFDNATYQVAGYRDGVLKYDTDTTKVCNDRLIWTYADAVSGNSGGPIFNGDTASAIYVAENNSGLRNVGCRITQDVFDKVFEMAGTKPPSTTTKDPDPALIVNPDMTGPDGYILPYAQSRLYKRKELATLSTYALYLARNEISARHGYIFSNKDLRDYFGSKSWYRGTLTREQFRSREGILNATEEKNIQRILKLERKRGSIYAP